MYIGKKMSGYCYRWDHKYDQHLIYVGSTKNDKKREGEHRSDCHNPNSEAFTMNFYKHVRKYGTIDHWEMTELYKGPDYRIFEKNYIKSTWEYNLNKYIPLQTKQERKDYLQNYRFNNYKNDEKSKAYQKVYQKVYRVANRDKQKAYNKVNKEKIQCENCGAFIRKDSKSRHIKSKKCMAFKR